MIVASIDTRSGDAVLFSIPRNLQQVPFPRDHPLHEVYPDGYDCGDQCLMNAIWTEAETAAEEHPEWYADDSTPGLTATREVLSTVLGLPIHHTVIVNLEGFEDLAQRPGEVGRVAGEVGGTAEHQPLKVAAMEGHWERRPEGEGMPLVLWAVPDQEAGTNRQEVAIPRLGGVILTHSWDGQIEALDSAPAEDRPPVAPVFFAFRIMVGIGTVRADDPPGGGTCPALKRGPAICRRPSAVTATYAPRRSSSHGWRRARGWGSACMSR